LLATALLPACDGGSGARLRDSGSDDGPPDAGLGDGGTPATCLPGSLARSPWNGLATGSVHASAPLRPTFRWASVRGATSYDLVVDDSCGADFRSCAFPSPEIEESTADLSFTPAADLPVSTTPPVGRRYFWRVRSCRDTVCSAWSEVRYLDVGRSPGDLDGDGYADAVVGARSKDAGAANEGNVFVYHGSATALPLLPDETLDNPQNQANAGFGYAVALADVNGDGFSDLVVGAPSQENGASNEGAAFVFLGSAAGLPDAPEFTLDNPDNEALAFFGAAVGSAGDLDGDGFEDIAVGAYARQGGNGGAFVYLGSASGIAATPSLTLDRPTGFLGTSFGVAVASAGDTGGDGYADLLVGATGDDPGNEGGAVFVYCGAKDGIGAQPDLRLHAMNQLSGDEFGAALAGGDMDGDGLGDVAVGAPATFTGGTVSYFLGSPSGLRADPSGSLSGDMGRFATSLGAGDLDGDGLADLVVGADEHEQGAAFEGAAFVFPGTPGGPAAVASPALDNPDNAANGHFGASVAVLGDADGDGDGELIVGAPEQADTGQAFIYYGDGAGIATTPDVTLAEPDAQNGAKFGYSVALLWPPFAPDTHRLWSTRALAPGSLPVHGQ
jgi:FG-GAP repeat protein